MSETPCDTANIEGFCLSGWNTKEFYCLPLANLYFLKFLKGMRTHFVIKRGSKAIDNTLAGGGGRGEVLVLPWLSQDWVPLWGTRGSAVTRDVRAAVDAGATCPLLAILPHRQGGASSPGQGSSQRPSSTNGEPRPSPGHGAPRSLIHLAGPAVPPEPEGRSP